MNRRFFRILMILAACLCLSLDFRVYAKETVPDTPVYEADKDTFTYVSPLSRKSIADADIQQLRTQEADNEPAVYGTLEEAVTGLRETVKKRELPFSFRLGFETDLSYEELFDLVAEHNGVPDEGDYIFGQCRAYSFRPDGNGNVVFNAYFDTTAEMEAEVDAAVDEILESLNLEGFSDEEKILRVYRYISDNCTYEFSELDQTAYSVVIEKKSVCNGFAVAFYRFMTELGIDCRYIYGWAEEDPSAGDIEHAWNIVRIGDYYYNVDSTWDLNENLYHGECGWLLRSGADFRRHTRNERYLTEDFLDRYPVAEESLTVNPIVECNLENTESQDGYIYYYATVFGNDFRTQWQAYDEENEVWSEVNYMQHLSTKTCDVRFSLDSDRDGVMHRFAVYSRKGDLLYASDPSIPRIPANYYPKEWHWSDDLSSCTVIWANSNGKTVEKDAAITVTEIEPTCEEEGYISHTAYSRYYWSYRDEVKTDFTPALGHDYRFTSFIWSDDYSKAQALLTCARDESHTDTVSAEVTSVIETPAACESAGSTVYTASVTVAGEEFSESVTVTVPAKGHRYVLKEWKWTEDYTGADAVFVCQNDSEHIASVSADITSVKEDAGCIHDGLITYKASVEFEGRTYTDERTVTIPQYGHDWNEPVYIWADDYSNVHASAECERCGEEISENCGPRYDVIQEPEDGKPGIGVYTADFVNPVFTTQTKTVEIPARNMPQSVSLDHTSLSLIYNSSVKLSATVEPSDAEDKTVTWSSADEGIAAIDQDGRVRGVKPGLTEVTATTVNGLSATCTVRVLFTDVSKPDQYFYEPVYWAVDNGITVGAGGAGKFSPNNPCTREQIVTFLWRLMDEPEPETESDFTDVEKNAWYYKPITWAYENGITTGLNDGTGRFGVGQSCTREQCVTFLYRAAEEPEVTSHESFTDVAEGRYYYDAISWAASKGITVGLNDGTGRFGVGQKCTRAMIVTFLSRYASLKQ